MTHCGGLRITLSTHATYTLINVVFFSPGLKSAPSLALIFSLSLPLPPSLSLSRLGGGGSLSSLAARWPFLARWMSPSRLSHSYLGAATAQPQRLVYPAFTFVFATAVVWGVGGHARASDSCIYIYIYGHLSKYHTWTLNSWWKKIKKYGTFTCYLTATRYPRTWSPTSSLSDRADRCEKELNLWTTQTNICIITREIISGVRSFRLGVHGNENCNRLGQWWNWKTAIASWTKNVFHSEQCGAWYYSSI